MATRRGRESNNRKDKANRWRGGLGLRIARPKWTPANWDEWSEAERRRIYSVCLAFLLLLFHVLLYLNLHPHFLHFYSLSSAHTLPLNPGGWQCGAAARTRMPSLPVPFAIYKSWMAKLVVKWGYAVEAIVKFPLLPFISACRALIPRGAPFLRIRLCKQNTHAHAHTRTQTHNSLSQVVTKPFLSCFWQHDKCKIDFFFYPLNSEGLSWGWAQNTAFGG